MDNIKPMKISQTSQKKLFSFLIKLPIIGDKAGKTLPALITLQKVLKYIFFWYVKSSLVTYFIEYKLSKPTRHLDQRFEE